MITDDVEVDDSTPFDRTTLPNSEIHNAGEIWATMMFDALVAMIRRSREPGAPYSFEEARRRLGRYIVTGMQLAPRAPTYTEQRDAIVAAALENDIEDARLIAEAFAGRGLGTLRRLPRPLLHRLRGRGGALRDRAAAGHPRAGRGVRWRAAPV